MEATRGGLRGRSPVHKEEIVLAAYGLLGGSPAAVSVALVWFAHIAMDRLVGYGLKYPTEFGTAPTNKLSSLSWAGGSKR